MLRYMQRIVAGGPRAASMYTEKLMDFHKEHIKNYVDGWTPPPPPTPEVRFIYDSAMEYEATPKQESIFFNRQCHWRKWPLPNVWLGTTCENQEQADKRIPILLQIPAAVRFVSVEPMLSEVFLNRYLKWPLCKHWKTGGNPNKYGEYHWEKQTLVSRDWVGLDWVICGGESGPGARPMHPDWVQNLRDQCQAAGVPFFFKQWGEFIQCDYEGNDYGASYIDAQCIDGELWDLDKCDENGNLYSIGNNLTCPKCKGFGFIRVSKKAAGRLLDGCTWDEMPVL